jgi:hypothetical protein
LKHRGQEASVTQVYQPRHDYLFFGPRNGIIAYSQDEVGQKFTGIGALNELFVFCKCASVSKQKMKNKKLALFTSVEAILC